MGRERDTVVTLTHRSAPSRPQTAPTGPREDL